MRIAGAAKLGFLKPSWVYRFFFASDLFCLGEGPAEPLLRAWLPTVFSHGCRTNSCLCKISVAISCKRRLLVACATFPA